jgi:hypothetical protein
MPEFAAGGMSAYEQAGINFLSGDGPVGSYTLYTMGGGMFRVQPSTGYFGYVNSSGTISTFFRVTNQDPFQYFLDQFSGAGQ